MYVCFFLNCPELYPLDMMILHVYPTQGDQHQGIDFHCDTHVSVLKAADFIKAIRFAVTPGAL